MNLIGRIFGPGPEHGSRLEVPSLTTKGPLPTKMVKDGPWVQMWINDDSGRVIGWQPCWGNKSYQKWLNWIDCVKQFVPEDNDFIGGEDLLYFRRSRAERIARKYDKKMKSRPPIRATG